MNAAHFHLIVNHSPIFGALFSSALILFGVMRKSDELIRMAYIFFVITALGAAAAYYSGEPAEEVVEHKPGVTEDVIEPHEQAAAWAFGLAALTGVGSLGALVFLAKGRAVPDGLKYGILTAGLFTTVAMGRTANLGGEIRHEEIRTEATSPQAEK